ncbi:MAG TPA: toll/interleukin-1 receptor domain-containing protein [Anaerolineae bacterium]|nr:toll/interleukin-1 receptor domain-containing protein [Anaerolineae bacterium]
MKQLWQESRGNIIAGFVVAGGLALISWLSTLYADVGSIPFVLSALVILWIGYFGYIAYWLSQHYHFTSPAGENDHPMDEDRQSTVSEPAAASAGPFYPCFISYAHQDEAFAEKLYADLRDEGIQCWYAPEDLEIGARIRQTLDDSIETHEKLLLILSEHSIDSIWVEKEVETAFDVEQKSGRLVLFPIRLDETVMETNQAWAADIRRMRHIGNFTQWREEADYQRALKRLLRDLTVKDVASATASTKTSKPAAEA